MKTLLVNPPPRSPDQPNISVPPLGLAYLAAVLEKNGYPVRILDASALNLSWEEFRKTIKKQKPDIVGLTGTTPTIGDAYKAAEICRPWTKHLVLGGCHATVFGQSVFEVCPEIDFLVIGEGESVFLKLVQALTGKKNPSKIMGVVTSKKINPRAPLIKNLDSLPFPARHLLPNPLYRYSLVRKYPFTTMSTSRGCPFHCLFCDKGVFGKTYRMRSAESVLAEIEEVTQKYQVKTIVLMDDLFTVNRPRLIKICEGLIKRNLKVDWKAEARVDTVDKEILTLMKRAGCSVLCYGVESANQKTLDFLEKGTRVAQIKKTLRLSRKVGIQTLGYFILGVPGETYAKAQKTIQLSLDYCDFAAYNVLAPFPGSRLYPLALKRDWIAAADAQNPFDQEPERMALVSKEWPAENLKKIIREANIRYNFRPKYLLRQAFSLRSPTQARVLLKYGLRLVRWSLKSS